MKVLMIGPARRVKGGISAVVNNYYKLGLDNMVELRYLATMEEGSKLHKLKVALLALLKYPFAVAGADIVHIHMASDSSLLRKLPFLVLSKWWKKKIVLHQHGGNFSEYYHNQCSKSLQKLIIFILKKADLVLVVAPHLKEEFEVLLNPSKVQLFENTILIPKYKKENYEGKDLLFLGRLCTQKGVRELLDTVVSLREEYPDLQLYLGGVWEESELKKVANKHREYIHQLGWIGGKEKEEMLKKCNIFVLPTYFEGMPISLLEAMSYGCACIASEVGGIPKVMAHNREGLLIKPESKESLMEALKLLFTEEGLQERLGQAAAKKMKEEYSMEDQLQQLVEYYNALLCEQYHLQ